MDKDSNDEKLKAVEKVLGEPVFIELSDYVLKIRTNLIRVSVITIAVILANLHIDQGSTVLGLKFTGLNDHVLRAGLLVITCYLGAHYLWTAVDTFLEWRLRITGTRLSFVTTGRIASEHADYPNDPRQSTLYYWWLSEAKRIGDMGSELSNMQNLLESLDIELRAKMNSGTDALNIVNACRPLGEVRETIGKLGRSIEQTQKAIEATRIPISLKRFDNWFKFFLRSQNLRWLIIDLLVPLTLWGTALYLLCK